VHIGQCRVCAARLQDFHRLQRLLTVRFDQHRGGSGPAS
jgi:hypothetical protein